MMKVAFKMLGGQVPRLSAYEYIKAWRQEIAQAQSQGWCDQSSLHLGQLLLYWSLKKGMRGLLWKWPRFRRLHQCIKALKLLTIADWLVLEYIRLTSYLHAQITKDLAFDAGLVKSCYCADSAFTIYHHVFYCGERWKCPRTWVLERELPTPVNVKPKNGLLVETMVSETVILGLTFACVNCATVRWVATACVVDISWDLLFQCPAEGFTFTMMCYVYSIGWCLVYHTTALDQTQGIQSGESRAVHVFGGHPQDLAGNMSLCLPCSYRWMFALFRDASSSCNLASSFFHRRSCKLERCMI